MSWAYGIVNPSPTISNPDCRASPVSVTQTVVCAVRTMEAMTGEDTIRKRLSGAIAAALDDLERLSRPEERYRSASWLVDHLADAISAAGKLRAQAVVALRDEENLSLAQLGERLGLSKARAADIVRDISKAGRAQAPELRPVVAVIVTSPEGVLAVRRSDKKPLWTFPSGELKLGETASDAAVRETREETGLDIVPGRILGRRTHQQTGRQMIYLAARPARHADAQSVFIGDDIELDEVRWLARAEVDELMPGAFEPVLAYLDRDHRRHTA
jgi:ADP-ribose pyrophosphatase YjhB (NUDIX family)